MELVKMRSDSIRMDSKSNESVPVRDRKGHTETEGRRPVMTEAEVGRIRPQPEDARSPQ